MAVDVLSVDPQVLATLFHRCIRCMYLYVHEGTDPHVGSQTFFETAARAMEAARRADSFVDLESERVRILSQGERLESAPIPFPDFGLQLALTGTAHGLLELKNGGTVIAAYGPELDAHRIGLYSSGLAGYAFAAENPAAQTRSPTEVRELGVVEFAMTLVPKGKGVSASVFRPARLLRLERRPEQFTMFLHIVARILAAHKPPRRNEQCPYCGGQK